MGHSEMSLAVAGLKEQEVKQRIQKLAAGDWSDFSAAEALALGFACKLSNEPTAISRQDVKALEDALGKHRTVDVIWLTAFYNYMTRISNAFQLPLERDNAFDKP